MKLSRFFPLPFFVVFATVLSAQTGDMDLFSAARSGTVAQVKAAIARGESLTGVQSSHGLTPLAFAVQYNTVEVAKVLVQAGSSLSKRNAAGANLLMDALMFNKDIEMPKWLIKLGAKLNERDTQGWTPLMYATINPNPEMARYVLSLGVKVNDRNYSGGTALSMALQYSSAEVVQDMLKAGALVKDRDNRGVTPLMQAAARDDTTTIPWLLKAGANMEEKDMNGATAFFIAANNKNLSVVRAFLEAGAKAKVKDSTGVTPLMIAALYNTNPEMIQLLVEAGLGINDRDDEGLTPLLWAAKGNQNPKVVLALLKAGADPTIIGKNGQTPLPMVRESPNLMNTEAQTALEKAPQPDPALIKLPPVVKQPSLLPEGTWVLLNDGTARTWLNEEWVVRPGARLIAQRAGQVWSLGTEEQAGNFPLRQWKGNVWENVGVAGVRLTVGPDGEPWLVDNEKRIRHRVKGEWKVHPGFANDIGVGADGTIWIIGDKPVGKDFEILRWDGKKWLKTDGHALQIAVDPKGKPWVINSNGTVYSRASGAWVQQTNFRAKSVSIGKDGTAVIVVTEGSDDIRFIEFEAKVLLMWKPEFVAVP